MGLKVCKERCDECLFSDKRIVSKKRMAQIIKDCRKNDNHFICHKPALTGEKTEIVCKGFYETNTSQMIRIAQRMNMIEFVEVPKAEHEPS